MSACLYDSRGDLFAEYFRKGAPACPPHAPRDESGFVGEHFVLYQPVGADEQRLGSLRIVASLGQLRRADPDFGTVLVLVLLASALVALALSSWLQGFFSRPITDLAETAKGVTKRTKHPCAPPNTLRTRWAWPLRPSTRCLPGLKVP